MDWGDEVWGGATAQPAVSAPLLDRDGNAYMQPQPLRLLDAIDAHVARRADGTGHAVVEPVSGKVLATGDTADEARETAQHFAAQLGRRRLQAAIDAGGPGNGVAPAEDGAPRASTAPDVSGPAAVSAGSAGARSAGPATSLPPIEPTQNYYPPGAFGSAYNTAGMEALNPSNTPLQRAAFGIGAIAVSPMALAEQVGRNFLNFPYYADVAGQEAAQARQSTNTSNQVIHGLEAVRDFVAAADGAATFVAPPGSGSTAEIAAQDTAAMGPHAGGVTAGRGLQPPDVGNRTAIAVDEPPVAAAGGLGLEEAPGSGASGVGLKTPGVAAARPEPPAAAPGRGSSPPLAVEARPPADAEESGMAGPEASVGAVPEAEAARSIEAARLQAAASQEIQLVGGRAPINSRYAGQTYPLENLPQELQVKHPDSINFTPQGFPDFSPHSIAEVQIDDLTGNYANDAALANEAVGLDATPQGYVWHHVEDGETMRLIPQDIHNAVRHTGGAAVIRYGQ